MSKHWEFTSSPIPDGKPKTRADVPEEVLCVVKYSRNFCVRKRKGSLSYSYDSDAIGNNASDYDFVSYIDGHRPEKTPRELTVADVPEGRCFRYESDDQPTRYIRWKHERIIMIKYSDGDIFQSCQDLSSTVTLLPMIAVLVDDPNGGDV